MTCGEGESMIRRSVGIGWLAGSVLFVLCASALGQDRSSGAAAYRAQLEEQWKKHPTLSMGSAAPDFTLPGVDGKKHSLNEYKNSSVLAIVFTCNHCPVAQLYEDRIKKMVDEYRPKGVAFVAIQPNAASVLAPRELNYTDVEDTLEGMVIRAKYRNFNFPYLYDGDTQAVADKYGPKVTPHVFIFDQERKLRYEGRIDDNQREALVKTRDARDALDALLAGRQPSVEHTAVFGCATKWKSQTGTRETEMKQLEAEPVNLDLADAGELKKLRSNPTGKLLMVNFWATWCGPCVAEFPELVKTYLWYRSRGFELVTVSADAPEARPAVLKFLQEQRSVVRNLLFASEDTYALQAAFDPKWESGVPYTVVIAPDGKVIQRQEGEVNILSLRRAILANLPDGSYVGNAAYWAQK